MKAPSMAPMYVSIYMRLVEVARECGYALALHGTMARDLDVVAVPWTEEAVDAEDLVRRLTEACAWTCGDDGLLVVGPTNKPHGRRAWSVPFFATHFVDVSVMPRTTP